MVNKDSLKCFMCCAAVCDPVMGDHGRLYVNPDLVPLYANTIVAVASIITPNQFEAEKLMGRQIRTEQDALAACQELHNRGPHTVVRCRA